MFCWWIRGEEGGERGRAGNALSQTMGLKYRNLPHGRRWSRAAHKTFLFVGGSVSTLALPPDGGVQRGADPGLALGGDSCCPASGSKGCLHDGDRRPLALHSRCTVLIPRTPN